MNELCNLTSKLTLKPVKTKTRVLIPLKEYRYYNHQIEVAKWMRVQEKHHPNGFKGGIISLTMGLGKTLITLSYALARYKNRPTLIVVPKPLLLEWKTNGVEKFFKDQQSKILYFHKDLNKKVDSLTLEYLMNHRVVITTTSMCTRTCLLGEYHKPREERNSKLIYRDRGRALLYTITWERIILDESHKCCNPTTKTFKYMMALSGKNKWCMSGTPIINYDTDIWAQLRLCGYSDIDSVSEWKKTGMNVFNQTLKTSIYALNYEGACIKLPPLIEHDIVIDLQDEYKDIYNVLRGQARQDYNRMVQLNESYSCMFALLTRLRQGAIAPYLISHEAKRHTKLTETFNLNKAEHGIRAPKMMKVVEILMTAPKSALQSPVSLFSLAYSKVDFDTLKNLEHMFCIDTANAGITKTIVFSMFVSALDLLGETITHFLPGYKYVQVDGDAKNKEELLHRFKYDQSVSCLLITYKVGSDGLNLTQASNCILLEPWWNNATLEQAKTRLWRLGQTKPVVVYNLITKDTIEEAIRDICTKKDEMIDSYMSGTRKTVQSGGLTKGMLYKLLQ